MLNTESKKERRAENLRSIHSSIKKVGLSQDLLGVAYILTNLVYLCTAAGVKWGMPGKAETCNRWVSLPSPLQLLCCYVALVVKIC